MPPWEAALPRGVKKEDILPKWYETFTADNGWVQCMRCSLQTAIFSRGPVFLCTNLCKVLWSKLCLDPVFQIIHCATFGERCEMVRKFFVRVLCSSRVDLIM